MAEKTINIGINISDNGSAKTTLKNVQALHSELKATQATAMAGGVSPKSEGRTAAAKAAYSAPGSSAVRSAYTSPSESVSYGQARGSMGATGASSRDFANQAQGLGGLVRLYATYAANVFAVSAAFSALREAMNTTIMIRGLDQLGAASGVAMGGLAKQFAAASDGAISLREAMEATAKATTSGLSSKQFMQLGVVAKGASQALGVNMSDAVSRLTRGITKLEPELLDELGIFTKVGKATEDYARSVGKSASALTDFERRQAFANAVLAEGQQKFGEIATQVNPYDKLLASLKNVAQGILENLNAIIGPVAKLFADNVALIGIAIAAATLKITQQALPALTSWRNGMKLAAEDAAKRAQEINTSFGEAFVERAQQRARVPQIQRALEAAEEEFKQAKRQFVELDNIYKKPNQTLRALQQDRLLNEKELVNIKADVTKKTNENTTASLQHAAGLVKVQLTQQKILDITKQLSDANDIVETQSNKRSRKYSEEWQREQLVIDSRAKAAKLGLLSSVGERVEQKGLTAGLGGFYTETMASKDIGRVDKFKTVVVGTFAGIGTAAGILGKSLMGAFMYLEIALVVFGALNSMFSKNGAAIDSFKSSMDGLNESTKTAINVSEKFGNTLSTESINAKANAFSNLTDSLAQTGKALGVADTLASGWDKFIDGIKIIWGGDLRQVFSKGFSESIASAIQLAPEGEIRQSLEGKLSGILGTKDLGLESVAKAVSKIPSKDLVQTAKNVNQILQESGKILKNSQALTQDVKETGKAASDAFMAFSTSVFGSTQLDTFLISTTKSVFSIKNAFKDSTAAAAEFSNIISGTTKLEFLPQAQAEQLQSLAKNYTDMQYGLKAQINDLDKTRNRITEITDRLKTPGLFTRESSALVAERAALKEKLPKLQLDVRQAESGLKELATEAGKILGEAAAKQTELVFAQTKQRLAQLDIGYKQQVMQGLPVTTEASIKESANLARQAINVEFSLKQSNESLINSIDLLRIQMELTQAQEKVKFAKGESRLTGGPELVAEAEKAQKAIEDKLAALKSGKISDIQKFVTEDPAALKIIMNLENQRINTRERNNKLNLENMKEALSLAEFNATQETKTLQLEIDRNNEAQKLLEIKKGISEEEKARSAAEIAAQNALKQGRLSQIPLELQAKQVDIRTKFGLPESVGKETQKELAKQMGQVAVTTGVTGTVSAVTTEVKAQLEAYKELSDIALKKFEIESLGATEALQNQKDSVTADRERLSLASATGAKTEEQIVKETSILDLKDAEIDRAQKLLDIEKTRTLELSAWTAKYIQFGFTPEVERERDAILARDEASKNAAERDYQGKLRSASITEELASRQTKYETVFKNSFERMGDAIIEFAKTGKFGFKELVNSMLEDILRIELRMQTSTMWAALRPGISAGLSTLFGTSAAPEQLGGPGGPATFDAKGHAYDYGVQAFAKGGMFTNSIVDSPTLFKFAKGTGLMGEAGPEAIMPLTRDGSGNLGVRAQGGNGGGGSVEVVVNNFGSEKATTKETTDSRGNRKVEVIIGDMVAQEVSKTGSATQNAFSSTYGTRPALARR